MESTDWGAWQDIAKTMAAIESLHSCTLAMELKREQGGYTGFVSVVITATCPILTGPALPLRLSLYSHYPIHHHSSLHSLVSSLLRRIEERINQEVYKQQNLFTE